jgi:hypothetical protein
VFLKADLVFEVKELGHGSFLPASCLAGRHGIKY